MLEEQRQAMPLQLTYNETSISKLLPSSFPGLWESLKLAACEACQEHKLQKKDWFEDKKITEIEHKVQTRILFSLVVKKRNGAM